MKNPLIIARRTLKSGKKIVRVHCLRVRLRDSCNITQLLLTYFEVLLNYQSWLKISTLSAPQSFRLAYFGGQNIWPWAWRFLTCQRKELCISYEQFLVGEHVELCAWKFITGTKAVSFHAPLPDTKYIHLCPRRNSSIKSRNNHAQ